MSESNASAECSAGRIAMVVHRYNLAASPSLINMVHVLVEQRHCVDIYVDHLRRREPRLEKAGIGLHIFRSEIGSPEPLLPTRVSPNQQARRRLPDWIYPHTRGLRSAFWSVYYGLVRLAQNIRLTGAWLQSLYSFSGWVTEQSAVYKEQYQCWIGVEPDGLIVAQRLSRGQDAKLVYYSLELLLEENLRSWMHRLKKALERRANRSADLTIVQDEARAVLLTEANGVAPERIAYIPVGARGVPVVGKTDYLRQRLHLGPDCKIILSAGSIADWSCARELAQAAQTWPPGWKLVLHGKLQPFPEEPGYMEELLQLAKHEQVILSTDWVSFKDLDELVASADVGVALYYDKDRNRQLTASSSGKIAQYLKCGLPLVVNDFPHTRALIHDQRCGVSVPDAAGVAEAVETILADHEHFRSNAQQRYIEYYRTDRYVLDIMRRLDLQPSAAGKR